MSDLVKSKHRLAARDFAVRVATFMGTEWYANLAPDMSFDDCLDPTFWRDVVHKIANHENGGGLLDDIVVFKRDTMSRRKYSIVGIGAGFIKLSLIETADGPVARELREDCPLKTRWNPGKKCHEVIRQDSGANVTVMAGSFQSKDKAIEWIDDHMRKMAT